VETGKAAPSREVVQAVLDILAPGSRIQDILL
jgi:hypothetical protein